MVRFWPVSAVLVLLTGPLAAAEAPDPTGLWMRDDGNARVRFAKCGDRYCATNEWIKDTSGGEEVGDKLVLEVKPSSASTMSGTAFDPKRNLTIPFVMTVGKASMSTRGCLVGGLVCKTASWSRIK